MKKLSEEGRLYHNRVTIAREERRLRNRKKSRNSAYRFGHGKSISIAAPEEFSLLDKDKRRALLRFIGKIREKSRSDAKLQLDFSNTKKMMSDGTLLFRSELCRLLKGTASPPVIRCTVPRNQKVSQVLKQVGIYDLLNNNEKVSPSDDDVVNWRVAQGTGADGEKYDEILGHYDGKVSEHLLQGLFVGLTEAMTNTQQHAYIKDRNDGHPVPIKSKAWWMFSQEKDGKLYVVFCDLGVGIPRSLPVTQPGLVERLTETLGFKPPDGRMISEAVVASRSRTKLSHRGKGLPQLVDFIRTIHEAKLYIFSNRGCYTVAGKNSNYWNYRDSILGTLIGWSVPLPEGASNDEQSN